MEYGRCSEWNEMEDLKNGMENCLPYFLTNYICSRLHIKTYYKLQNILPNQNEDNSSLFGSAV